MCVYQNHARRGPHQPNVGRCYPTSTVLHLECTHENNTKRLATVVEKQK